MPVGHGSAKQKMDLRESIKQHLGWHLLVGLLVFASMTALIVALSDQVMEGEPLTIIDAQLSNWLHKNGTSAQIQAFKIVTHLGSTVVAIFITSILSIYLLWRRQRYWFTTLLLSVAGGALLNRTLKLAFQRTRPQFDDPLMTFPGFSFPSGHTLTATVMYGCLAAIIVASTRNRLVQIAVIFVASVLIALVGFSRIFLGAHYLTDVLAAIAEGLAWLSLSFTLVYSLWRRRNGIKRT